MLSISESLRLMMGSRVVVRGEPSVVTIDPIRRAKTDKEGSIHLPYDSEDGPKYARSTDGGVTFGSAMPVATWGASEKAGLEYSAWDMAVGKGGRVHVAMGTDAWKLKLPQDELNRTVASVR